MINEQQHEACRQAAQEFGLGEFSDLEWAYISAELEYDWYAREPQMPNIVAKERYDTYRRFVLNSEQGRVHYINRFLNEYLGEPS